METEKETIPETSAQETVPGTKLERETESRRRWHDDDEDDEPFEIILINDLPTIEEVKVPVNHEEPETTTAMEPVYPPVNYDLPKTADAMHSLPSVIIGVLVVLGGAIMIIANRRKH